MSKDIEELLPAVYAHAADALTRYKNGTYNKSEAARNRAKAILNDPEATATAVFLATYQLLSGRGQVGGAFLAWEPESIWLELKDAGVDLSIENRDKLLAAITILHGDAFHWDAAIFENTIEAFNDIPSAPDAVQEASPGEIAWGAFEAELFAQFAGYVGNYDYEPTLYTALSMHRDGLVVAPELLAFAQEELDAANTDAAILKANTISRWEEVDKTKLENLELTETPEDVQVARLAAIHLYVGKRAQQLDAELANL